MRHRLAVSFGVLALVAVGSAPAGAFPEQRVAPQPRLVRVGVFDQPLYVTAPKGDPRLFVVEQPGRIRVVAGGRTRTFLDLTARTSADGERGLLSVAFAPDYRTSRRFYVDYTDRRGDTRIVEYVASRRTPDRARPSSARLVLRIRHPEPNHNGGQLQFGPDGFLYLGTGDGGGAGDELNHAQRRDTLLGKLLRIDPRRHGRRPYAVPRSNPYVGRAGRDEIYASGLRNPWRFSFDPVARRLVLADVGQDAYEEVDAVDLSRLRGANFGWRVFEGPARFAAGSVPGAVRPVLWKSHDAGWCAIVGGSVVRDPAVPALTGRYLYGDLCQPAIRSVSLAGGRAVGDADTGLRVPALSSFGVDGLGRVYATSLRGPVYRIR